MSFRLLNSHLEIQCVLVLLSPVRSRTLAVDLRTTKTPLPFDRLHTLAMLRRTVMVRDERANDDMAMPGVRQDAQRRGARARRVLSSQPFRRHLLTRLPFRYVLDILRNVPEEIDDVLVEPDGEWHTADAAYGSPTWMEQHPQAPDKKPPPALTRQMELAGKGSSQVWDLDDSDSDGERFVKREVLDSKMAFSSSPPPASSGPPSTTLSRLNSRDVGNVIDLTLDSDDEDQPPAPPPPRPAQSQSQRPRVPLTVRRDDRSPLPAPRHRRVETTPLPVLQPPPSGVPSLRMSTGLPSPMAPLQHPTGSMLGKRRDRESDDDPRYRSPDERERERDYDHDERDYRYSHKAPRRERSPSRATYSPPLRILPAINSERRTNGTGSHGYHNHNHHHNPSSLSSSSSSSSALPHPHGRPAPSLPPIQPRSSTYSYGPFARSPESSQSPTLSSPPVPPYYNNPPPAPPPPPPSNESYRPPPPPPPPVRSGGGYSSRRWETSPWV